jgi:diguanylate cyclase (GGDEF)-like protein
MSAHAIEVLLAANDRSLLRQLSYVLQEFGYRVVACADLETALSAMASVPFDFFILDDATLGRDFRRLAETRHAITRHVHVFLLCQEASGVNVLDAVEAGVDDFLAKPVSVGEILSRLRAAARYVEFDRRWVVQQWEDPLTGLWSQQAFSDRLQRELKLFTRTRKLGMVLLDLDLFRRVNACGGLEAGNHVLRTVGTLLKQNCAPGQFVARLEEDCFAVLLPDHSIEKASKWAERMRQAVAELPSEELRIDFPLTASLGVAACVAETDSPEDALRRARRALEDAKCSGGDCLICYGEHDEERRAWTKLLESGNPFNTSTARDVMTPLPVAIYSSDSVAHAVALVEQTQLTWLPVLDSSGSLLGVLSAQRLTEVNGNSQRAGMLVEQLELEPVSHLPEATAFQAVMERFLGDDETLLLVTKGTRPQGYIARDRFLSLVNPVDRETFAARSAASASASYLVVEDQIEVEA